MDQLLTEVLEAHGGLERWKDVKGLEARMSLGGPFWAGRGWPGIYDGQTVRLDPRREEISFSPYPQAGTRSLLKTAPERVTIETPDGEAIQRREKPRASFPKFELTTPWDEIQVAYFTSYAVWNYLTTPFLLTYPGVTSEEIEPWQEAGETWRRLAVTFPESIVTHNPEQTFYFNDDRQLTRLDYRPDVTDVLIVHYVYDYRSFGDFQFPTRRSVFRRRPDGTADQSLAVITLTIDDVQVEVQR